MTRAKGAFLRAWRPVMLMLLVYGGLYWWRPALAVTAAHSASAHLGEVLAVLPGIALLMGLFEVWLPAAVVQHHLGSRSGLGGILLALFLGTAPTGPLYVAFPVAAGLRRKGASPANLVIFLGSWAAIKVPQVMMEARFVGPRFALLRLGLTALALPVMGWLAGLLVPTSGGEEVIGCEGDGGGRSGGKGVHPRREGEEGALPLR